MEHGTNKVHESSVHALGHAVLLGSVGHGQLVLNYTVRDVVLEVARQLLTAVVTAKDFDLFRSLFVFVNLHFLHFGSCVSLCVFVELLEPTKALIFSAHCIDCGPLRVVIYEGNKVASFTNGWNLDWTQYVRVNYLQQGSRTSGANFRDGRLMPFSVYASSKNWRTGGIRYQFYTIDHPVLDHIRYTTEVHMSEALVP